MKKIVLSILTVLLLSGCFSKNIAPGTYVLNNSSKGNLYLIDVKTGKRYFQLENDKFLIEVGSNKKIASFIFKSVDPSKNNLETEMELGFFNSKMSTYGSEVLLAKSEPEKNADGIIIKADKKVLSASDGELVGTSLIAFGPLLYEKNEEGFYYFYIGVNYLKVDVQDVIVVKYKKSEDGGIIEEPTVDINIVAYEYLLPEIQELISDKEDATVSSETIKTPGVVVRNAEDNKDITITNKDVVVVRFLSTSNGDKIEVYLDNSNYNMLGFVIIKASQP